MGRVFATIIHRLHRARAAARGIYGAGLILVGVIAIWGYIWQKRVFSEREPVFSSGTDAAEFHLTEAMVPEIYQYLRSQPVAAPTQPLRPILGALTSHHLLAKELINDVISQSCDKSLPQTIVIVSPDHFHALRAFPRATFALVSNFNWQTPQSLLSKNQTLTMSASQQIGVKSLSDPTSIGQEHGVFALLPFVEHWCQPKSVTAIILNPDQTTQALELGKVLADTVEDTHPLVIVSSDFVHNTPFAVAKSLDKTNREVLLQIGQQTAHPDFSNITSDCPACVALLHGYLLETHRATEVLLHHQTSADYGGDARSVTTYFGGWWTAEK